MEFLRSFLDDTLRGNQWWRHEMSAVVLSYVSAQIEEAAIYSLLHVHLPHCVWFESRILWLLLMHNGLWI